MRGLVSYYFDHLRFIVTYWLLSVNFLYFMACCIRLMYVIKYFLLTVLTYLLIRIRLTARYILRESYRRRKMYCGHARLCVCVSVCLPVRGRTPTLLHGPGCNLGAW